MAKKDVRVVKVPDDIAGMIDKGVDIDNEVKNLTFEDKACKQGITDFAKNELEKDESSVLLEGKKGIALVSQVQSYKVEGGADTFPEMVRTAKLGLLGGVVKMERTLVVPPSKIDEAVEALIQVGISASIVEDFSVKPADYRKHKEVKTASEDVQKATEALNGCLSVSDSYRVKYSVKGD